MPPIDAVSETRSRVVPGISVTMARSCSSSAVEQAALADIGPAHDGERKPVLHQAAVLEAGGQRADAVQHRVEAAQDFGIGRHADIVLGEIDAGFEQRDQFQQLLLQRRDAARNRAAGLLRGDPRLVERGGFDQVAHGFGLGQIDAAVAGRRAG